MFELLTQTTFSWTADHTIAEFLAAYVAGAALIVGPPAVFFYIVFMSALQNTKVRMVVYNEHVKYGNSSINTFSRSDLKVGPEVPVRELSFPLKKTEE